MCFFLPEDSLQDVQTFQYFLKMVRLSSTPVSSEASVPQTALDFLARKDNRYQSNT